MCSTRTTCSKPRSRRAGASVQRRGIGWFPGLRPARFVLAVLLTAGSACGPLDAPRLAEGGLGGGRAPGPDLVLHAVTVRQDRLVILMANVGATEFGSPIMVTVSDGTPRQIDLGSPLRPGEALEAVLNTEYVQRRARVVVVVATAAEVDGAKLDNNRLEVVVGPDQQLDLALESAALDPVDGHLVVTVGSRGPVPLVGVVTIIAREPAPSHALLGASDQPLDIAARGTQVFDLRAVIRPNLARVIVSISTDAIADADATNDFLPR